MVWIYANPSAAQVHATKHPEIILPKPPLGWQAAELRPHGQAPGITPLAGSSSSSPAISFSEAHLTVGPGCEEQMHGPFNFIVQPPYSKISQR